MTIIRPDNYITIQGWMITELNLKGQELIAYAVIHGFSQLGNHWFTGSLKYLSEWMNSNRANVCRTLKGMVEKGLLEKREVLVGGVNEVSYRTLVPQLQVLSSGQQGCYQNDNGSVIKMTTGCYQNDNGGVIKMITNNIVNNIADNIEDNINNPYSPFSEFWNAYPRHDAKAQAEKAWKKLKADKKLTDHILFAIKRFKESDQWQDPKYIPMASTWLNQQRWEDIEPPKPKPKLKAVEDPNLTIEDRIAGKGIHWVKDD